MLFAVRCCCFEMMPRGFVTVGKEVLAEWKEISITFIAGGASHKMVALGQVLHNSGGKLGPEGKLSAPGGEHRGESEGAREGAVKASRLTSELRIPGGAIVI